MVVEEPSVFNIMGGMENTAGVRLHNHRRKLKQRFDIIRKLGQGTYGKVQMAVNKETGQEVAIKTIKKAKIETEADLIRIRREIQIMSSVQHPNIIHIYEVFENREKMVIVMQYAAGGELYDYLSEKKVLSEVDARRIFRQIASAVYYCHKHKICHRDLKLENILLDEHGNAKIADFGLSNVFDDCHLLNTFCGSPLYASPEIVKGTPYLGPEVDCWSLGVLLYTLVYGAMPFDGSNFKRLVKQITQGDYYEPKKPSSASSLIHHMLTVTPKHRANIEDICTHWWVNEGYGDSCLEFAEDLANQMPVRLDLLLSLAQGEQARSDQVSNQKETTVQPPLPEVTGDLMNEYVNNADVFARSHSLGSLMEVDQSDGEKPGKNYSENKSKKRSSTKDSHKRKIEASMSGVNDAKRKDVERKERDKKEDVVLEASEKSPGKKSVKANTKKLGNVDCVEITEKSPKGRKKQLSLEENSPKGQRKSSIIGNQSPKDREKEYLQETKSPKGKRKDSLQRETSPKEWRKDYVEDERSPKGRRKSLTQERSPKSKKKECLLQHKDSYSELEKNVRTKSSELVRRNSSACDNMKPISSQEHMDVDVQSACDSVNNKLNLDLDKHEQIPQSLSEKSSVPPVSQSSSVESKKSKNSDNSEFKLENDEVAKDNQEEILVAIKEKIKEEFIPPTTLTKSSIDSTEYESSLSPTDSVVSSVPPSASSSAPSSVPVSEASSSKSVGKEECFSPRLEASSSKSIDKEEHMFPKPEKPPRLKKALRTKSDASSALDRLLEDIKPSNSPSEKSVDSSVVDSSGSSEFKNIKDKKKPESVVSVTKSDLSRSSSQQSSDLVSDRDNASSASTSQRSSMLESECEKDVANMNTSLVAPEATSDTQINGEINKESIVKMRNDISNKIHKDIKSESSGSSTPEKAHSPARSGEKRLSRIFKTAEIFNNLSSQAQEQKSQTLERPKKVIIPGLKISDARKVFENKTPEKKSVIIPGLKVSDARKAFEQKEKPASVVKKSESKKRETSEKKSSDTMNMQVSDKNSDSQKKTDISGRLITPNGSRRSSLKWGSRTEDSEVSSGTNSPRNSVGGDVSLGGSGKKHPSLVQMKETGVPDVSEIHVSDQKVEKEEKAMLLTKAEEKNSNSIQSRDTVNSSEDERIKGIKSSRRESTESVTKEEEILEMVPALKIIDKSVMPEEAKVKKLKEDERKKGKFPKAVVENLEIQETRNSTVKLTTSANGQESVHSVLDTGNAAVKNASKVVSENDTQKMQSLLTDTTAEGAGNLIQTTDKTKGTSSCKPATTPSSKESPVSHVTSSDTGIKPVKMQVVPGEIKMATMQVTCPEQSNIKPSHVRAKSPFVTPTTDKGRSSLSPTPQHYVNLGDTPSVDIAGSESSYLKSIIEKKHNEEAALPKFTSEKVIGAIVPKTPKPLEKKKTEMEIVLNTSKSATLPRASHQKRWSAAEIQLGMNTPPTVDTTVASQQPKYRTEVQQNVGGDDKEVQMQRSEVSFPVSAAEDTSKPYTRRATSVEPSLPTQKSFSKERIIPIKMEDNSVSCSTEATVILRPHRQAQTSVSAEDQRTQPFSRVSSVSQTDSDTESVRSRPPEPIKKSPREFIIPITLEGGGYVTPKEEEELTERASGDSIRNDSSLRRGRFHRNKSKRFSSLFSDSGTSEDESCSVFSSPFGNLQRLSSFGKHQDKGDSSQDDSSEKIGIHRLRSSRPGQRERGHTLEHSDSFSSADEDDDDGFEILTAENLFTTLLSRVRSLTRRLNRDDPVSLPSQTTVKRYTYIPSNSRESSCPSTPASTSGGFWSNLYNRSDSTSSSFNRQETPYMTYNRREAPSSIYSRQDSASSQGSRHLPEMSQPFQHPRSFSREENVTSWHRTSSQDASDSESVLSEPSSPFSSITRGSCRASEERDSDIASECSGNSSIFAQYTPSMARRMREYQARARSYSQDLRDIKDETPENGCEVEETLEPEQLSTHSENRIERTLSRMASLFGQSGEVSSRKYGRTKSSQTLPFPESEQRKTNKYKRSSTCEYLNPMHNTEGNSQSSSVQEFVSSFMKQNCSLEGDTGIGNVGIYGTLRHPRSYRTYTRTSSREYTSPESSTDTVWSMFGRRPHSVYDVLETSHEKSQPSWEDNGWVGGKIDPSVGSSRMTAKAEAVDMFQVNSVAIAEAAVPSEGTTKSVSGVAASIPVSRKAISVPASEILSTVITPTVTGSNATCNNKRNLYSESSIRSTAEKIQNVLESIPSSTTFGKNSIASHHEITKTYIPRYMKTSRIIGSDEESSVISVAPHDTNTYTVDSAGNVEHENPPGSVMQQTIMSSDMPLAFRDVARQNATVLQQGRKQIQNGEVKNAVVARSFEFDTHVDAVHRENKQITEDKSGEFPVTCDVTDNNKEKKERRRSRFLRPDFFDTPKEESIFAMMKDKEKEKYKSRFLKAVQQRKWENYGLDSYENNKAAVAAPNTETTCKEDLEQIPTEFIEAAVISEECLGLKNGPVSLKQNRKGSSPTRNGQYTEKDKPLSKFRRTHQPYVASKSDGLLALLDNMKSNLADKIQMPKDKEKPHKKSRFLRSSTTELTTSRKAEVVHSSSNVAVPEESKHIHRSNGIEKKSLKQENKIYKQEEMTQRQFPEADRKSPIHSIKRDSRSLKQSQHQEQEPEKKSVGRGFKEPKKCSPSKQDRSSFVQSEKQETKARRNSVKKENVVTLPEKETPPILLDCRQDRGSPLQIHESDKELMALKLERVSPVKSLKGEQSSVLSSKPESRSPEKAIKDEKLQKELSLVLVSTPERKSPIKSAKEGKEPTQKDKQSLLVKPTPKRGSLEQGPKSPITMPELERRLLIITIEEGKSLNQEDQSSVQKSNSVALKQDKRSANDKEENSTQMQTEQSLVLPSSLGRASLKQSSDNELKSLTISSSSDTTFPVKAEKEKKLQVQNKENQTPAVITELEKNLMEQISELNPSSTKLNVMTDDSLLQETTQQSLALEPEPPVAARKSSVTAIKEQSAAASVEKTPKTEPELSLVAPKPEEKPPGRGPEEKLLSAHEEAPASAQRPVWKPQDDTTREQIFIKSPKEEKISKITPEPEENPPSSSQEKEFSPVFCNAQDKQSLVKASELLGQLNKEKSPVPFQMEDSNAAVLSQCHNSLPPVQPLMADPDSVQKAVQEQNALEEQAFSKQPEVRELKAMQEESTLEKKTLSEPSKMDRENLRVVSQLLETSVSSTGIERISTGRTTAEKKLSVPVSEEETKLVAASSKEETESVVKLHEEFPSSSPNKLIQVELEKTSPVKIQSPKEETLPVSFSKEKSLLCNEQRPTEVSPVQAEKSLVPEETECEKLPRKQLFKKDRKSPKHSPSEKKSSKPSVRQAMESASRILEQLVSGYTEDKTLEELTPKAVRKKYGEMNLRNDLHDTIEVKETGCIPPELFQNTKEKNKESSINKNCNEVHQILSQETEKNSKKIINSPHKKENKRAVAVHDIETRAVSNDTTYREGKYLGKAEETVTDRSSAKINAFKLYTPQISKKDIPENMSSLQSHFTPQIVSDERTDLNIDKYKSVKCSENKMDSLNQDVGDRTQQMGDDSQSRSGRHVSPAVPGVTSAAEKMVHQNHMEQGGSRFQTFTDTPSDSIISEAEGDLNLGEIKYARVTKLDILDAQVNFEECSTPTDSLDSMSMCSDLFDDQRVDDESVSERIHRRSFFTRFNEQKRKNRNRKNNSKEILDMQLGLSKGKLGKELLIEDTECNISASSLSLKTPTRTGSTKSTGSREETDPSSSRKSSIISEEYESSLTNSKNYTSDIAENGVFESVSSSRKSSLTADSIEDISEISFSTPTPGDLVIQKPPEPRKLSYKGKAKSKTSAPLLTQSVLSSLSNSHDRHKSPRRYSSESVLPNQKTLSASRESLSSQLSSETESSSRNILPYTRRSTSRLVRTSVDQSVGQYSSRESSTSRFTSRDTSASRYSSRDAYDGHRNTERSLSGRDSPSAWYRKSSEDLSLSPVIYRKSSSLTDSKLDSGSSGSSRRYSRYSIHEASGHSSGSESGSSYRKSASYRTRQLSDSLASSLSSRYSSIIEEKPDWSPSMQHLSGSGLPSYGSMKRDRSLSSKSSYRKVHL